MMPLVNAQKQVKDSSDRATYALKGETYAVEDLEQRQRDEAVAAQVAATQHEKAMAVILQETEQVHRSSEAHAHLAGSLAHLARPMQMMIMGAMHLAHSFALLTAANEEDAEAMVRKLAKYEGWIMGATGVLHVIHAMHAGYVILEKQAWLTAAAEAAALAPLELIVLAVAAVAAVGYGIYKVGEYFDWWGTQAAKAAEESRKAGIAIQEASNAYRDFERSRASSEAEGEEKKFGIRVKTDEKTFGHREQLAATDEEIQKLKEEREHLDTRMKDLAHRHLQERKNLEREQGERHFHENRVFFYHTAESDEQKDETRNAVREQGLRQAEEMKQLAEQAADVDERGAAAASRKVDILAAQRDHLQENLKTQREMVRAAEQELEAAREKERSRDESFGRLNEGQQAELKRINEKVGKGEKLTKQELEHIDRYGDDEAKAFAAEQYRQKGNREGRAGATSNLHREGHAPGQDVKSAEAKRDEAQRQLGNMQRELTKKENELRAAGKTAMTAVDKVTSTMVNLVQTLTRKIEELRDTLEAQQHNRK